MVLVDDIEAAVGRAIQFLLAEQRPSGEFPSVAAFLGDDPDWEDDTLTFVTALVTLALERVDDERALEMMRGARSFLEREREPGGQWRYWSHDHPRHDFTPPDADDTACASMALERSGTSTRENVPLLLANRDRAGRFYTWLVLHRPWPRSPRVWWGLRRELAGRRRRAELWDTTEAEFDDVDGVVNANVVRYLGDDAPPAAAAYVAELVEQDREAGCDSWHHSPFVLYASIADGHRRGVGRFDGLGPAVEEKICRAISSDGTVGTPYDTAHALSALLDFDRRRAVPTLAAGLVEAQRPDGSWDRSPCYYGGPQESFGWASDALTAAMAASALSRAGTVVL